jgi:ATP-dependent protease ClpP protease subunit
MVGVINVKKNIIRNCGDEDFDDPLMNSAMSVIRYEHNIYFYSEVNPESILNLILHLNDAVKLQRDMMLRFPEDNVMGVSVQIPIVIHINSIGGSVYDALAAIDTIKHHQKLGIKINTVIEGCAFSAATVLAVCGDRRFMTANSSYMIHEMSSSGFNGKLSEVEKLHKDMKTTTDIFKKIYATHSKATLAQIKKLTKEERYLSAEETLELGFIDEIL